MLSIIDPPPKPGSSFLSSLSLSLGLSLPLMAFLRRPSAAERSPSRSPGEDSSTSSFFFLFCLRESESLRPALEAPPVCEHKREGGGEGRGEISVCERREGGNKCV